MEFDSALRSLGEIGLTEAECALPAGEQDPNLPIFLCFPREAAAQRYEADGVAGCGTALEEIQARLIAVAECLESLCFYNPSIQSPSYGPYRRGSDQVDPARFVSEPDGAGSPGAKALRDAERQWGRARDLGTGEPVMLPVQVIADSPAVRAELPIRGERISSGLAIGPARSGMAGDNGLFEIVERDAVMGAYLGDRTPRQITNPPAPALALIDELAAKGVECLLFDVTSDIGAPAVAALCIDGSGDSPGLTAGAACRGTYAAAIEKALLEAIQSRAPRRALMQAVLPMTGARDWSTFGGQERVLFWCDPENLSALDGWFADAEFVDYADLADVFMPAEKLLGLLIERGWSVYEADITLPELGDAGFEAKRIICPELHPSHVAEHARARFSTHYGVLPNGEARPPHPFV